MDASVENARGQSERPSAGQRPETFRVERFACRASTMLRSRGSRNYIKVGVSVRFR
jgi:hypothetical protein